MPLSIQYLGRRVHNSDPIRKLNNFLQDYKDANGNLARYLSWLVEEEGPEHQRVHHATAKCEPFGHSDNSVLSCVVHGHGIGRGRGVSKSCAKQVAAQQALNYLSSLSEEQVYSFPR